MRTIVFILLINLLSVATISYAEPIVLAGSEVSHTSGLYYDRLRSIQEGSILIFKGNIFQSDRSFRVGKCLSKRADGSSIGGQAVVFELLDDSTKVIRIPKVIDSGIWMPRRFQDTYFNATIRGYNTLIKAGVPIINMYEYRHEQFIVVDRISGPSLSHFFLHPEKFSESERARMSKELVEFARTTARFSHLGDFNSNQLFFDNERGWTLIDWTDDVILAKKIHDHSIFEDFIWEGFYRLLEGKSENDLWFQKLYNDIVKTVYQERSANSCRALLKD